MAPTDSAVALLTIAVVVNYMPVGYRQKALAHNDGGCEICSEDNGLIVHHINGQRSDNGLPNLLVVCESCHKKIHYGSEGYGKWHSELPEASKLKTKDISRSSIPLDKPIVERMRALKPDGIGWNTFMIEVIEVLENDELEQEELADEVYSLRRELDEFKHELPRKVAEELR